MSAVSGHTCKDAVAIVHGVQLHSTSISLVRVLDILSSTYEHEDSVGRAELHLNHEEISSFELRVTYSINYYLKTRECHISAVFTKYGILFLVVIFQVDR